MLNRLQTLLPRSICHLASYCSEASQWWEANPIPPSRKSTPNTSLTHSGPMVLVPVVTEQLTHLPKCPLIHWSNCSTFAPFFETHQWFPSAFRIKLRLPLQPTKYWMTWPFPPPPSHLSPLSFFIIPLPWITWFQLHHTSHLCLYLRTFALAVLSGWSLSSF